MMMKYILTFLLLLNGVLAFAQVSACDSIVWRASRKLTWDDFKGTPDPNDIVSARSRSNFVREWSADNGKLKTTMICFFSPCLSWTKSKRSNRLLKHEQGHFDITEYYKRIYYQRIAQANYSTAALPDILRDVYVSVTQECGAMQEAYDRETHNSLLVDKQREWQRNIARLLSSVKYYDRKEMIVSLSTQ
jgi:hypothetical protein